MKNKRLIVTLTSLSMLAAVTLIGFYSAGRSNEENYVDLSQAKEPEIEVAEKRTEEEKKETAGGNVSAKNYQSNEIELEAPETEKEIIQPAVPTTEKIANLSFTEEDSLDWPVDGKVLMNYSMDQTIYFKTLEQYKYNPAVLISGEVNTPVLASARGRVVEISENEETGNTLTVDIGNDYSLVYGQLKEIPLQEGSMVEKGDIIGYIGETTKYYSEEGSNLYFAMKRNSAAKNPLDYMDTEGEE